MINRKALSLLFPLAARNRTLMPLLATQASMFSKQTELEKITKSGKDLDDIIPEINKPRDPDGGVHSV